MSKLHVDEIKGNTGTTVTVPTGQTLAVAANQTIGGTLAVTGASTLTGVVSKPATPRLSVWLYTGMTIAHNTYTLVQLNGTDLISGGMTGFTHSNSYSRFTATTAGDYFISGSMRWYTASGISTSRLGINKNGTMIVEAYSHSLPNYEQLHCSTIATLAVGDYLEMQVFQYSGGNVSLAAGKYVNMHAHMVA